MTHEQTGSDEEKQVHIHDWHEAVADISGLRAGDVISGFGDMLEMDIFATAVGDWLASPVSRHYFDPKKDFSLANNGDRVYDGWRDRTRPPSVALKPPKFHGKLVNGIVVMLEDGSEVQRGAGAQTDMIISADMHSTGRGIIGKSVKLMTLSRPAVPGYPPDSRYGKPISASYKKMPTDSAEKATLWLQREASTSSFLAIQKSLGKTILAGLPELGKRS
ncbi:MAG TPA: hypothetical protein VLE69_03435 [Candidatus Saccharimonadales bacterium]|nr:hypothetical protein [Candidatus Saccharimonadales bacterium]